MKQLKIALSLTAVIAVAMPFHALATPCADKTTAGEALMDRGNASAAASTLEQAVAECRKEGSKTARPFIALGKAYYDLKRPRDAIPLFQDAITRDPHLGLAYMDLGAAYSQIEDYDKSIEVLKQGLAQEPQPALRMKLNYNIGLSYIKLAAARDDTQDVRSEPYFKRASELDPSFGGSFFYLGVLAESARKDRAAAAGFYQQACDRKYQDGCQYLASIDQRMAAAGASAAPVAKLSPDGEALMDKVAAVYRAKGMDDSSISAVTTGLRRSCAQVPEPNCKMMLQNTAAMMK